MPALLCYDPPENPMTQVRRAALITRCCRMTGGDLHAGLLLYRLIAWTPSVPLDGYNWIAHSHEFFEAEVPLSYDQIKRACTRLRDLDLVRTRQAHYNRKNVTHYLLCPEMLALMVWYGVNTEPPTLETFKMDYPTNGDAGLAMYRRVQSLTKDQEAEILGKMGSKNRPKKGASRNVE